MRWLANTVGWAAVALTLAVALLGGSAAAAEENSAGIVVRHGDGTLVYVWVSFDEESITSEELLTRSGLEAVVTPFGGLGTAVCSLDGEGCPSSNCFCKSFSSPAFFWHFYTLRDGAWVAELNGSTSREVRDGDIDGWSWTADESELPSVTLDEIAALNGVRAAPVASPTNGVGALATEPSPTHPPATTQPTTLAVVIPPDSTPVARAPTTTAADSGTDWSLFAGMAAVAVAAAGVVIVRRRKPRTP